MPAAESSQRLGHVVSEEEHARRELQVGFPPAQCRIYGKKRKTRRQDSKRPADVKLAQSERSRRVVLFEQQPRDEEAAQAEKDVDSESSIARDVRVIGGLARGKTLADVVGQHERNGDRAPSVQ